jgi:thioredoxin reductase (NADPH)
VTDRRVAVLGTGRRGCAEAAFLRSYTADLTLVAPAGGHRLSAAQRTELSEAGIALAGPCRAISLTDDAIVLAVGDTALAFDSLYPALGLDSRSGLAAQLGAKLARDGCLVVDAHQRTSVAGLYAAGDVVLGLDQISHAMGEGGIAATAMRNDLARQAPIRRRAPGHARGSVPDPNTATRCTPR